MFISASGIRSRFVPPRPGAARAGTMRSRVQLPSGLQSLAHLPGHRARARYLVRCCRLIATGRSRSLSARPTARPGASERRLPGRPEYRFGTAVRPVRCNHQFGFSDFTSSPWFDATRLAARSGIARRASTDAAGSQAPGRPSWSPNPDDVPCAPAPGTCGSSSQPELGRAGIDEAPPSFSDGHADPRWHFAIPVARSVRQRAAGGPDAD
jgi:hypothetical protein